MPSQEKKLFGCPVCGFRVEGREEACPRCGTAYNKTTMFECPFCSELVSHLASSCPSCHIKYDDFHSATNAKASEESIDRLLMEIIEMESNQVKAEPKKFSCHNCSWMLDGTEEKCPKCGASLVDEAAFICPVCGAAVTESQTKCPDCGANFVDEEGETAPTEEPAPRPPPREPVIESAPITTFPEPMEFQEEPTDVEPVAEPPQEGLQTPAETAPPVKKTRTRKLKAKPKTGAAGGAQQKKKPAT
jgi:rubrerythrin